MRGRFKTTRGGKPRSIHEDGKVFGNLMAITPSEVARFEKEITIIWK